MKKSIFKTFVITCAIGAILASCENKEEELQDEQLQEIQDTPTKDAVLPTEVSEIAIEVAKIQKDGHEYRFIAVGENDDMVVTEKLYGNAEKNEEESLQSIDKTPFDLFISLTKENINVPERIAITAEDSALNSSGRNIQESTAILEIIDPNYIAPIIQKACTDVGSTNFRNSHCGGIPVASSPSDIRYCDNGLWNSLTRSSIYGGSWKEVDDTYTRTNVVCGLTRVQFYAWQNTATWPFSDWKWVLKYQVDFTDGVWYAYYYTSTNTERQVKRIRPYNSGTFRAYTRFF